MDRLKAFFQSLVGQTNRQTDHTDKQTNRQKGEKELTGIGEKKKRKGNDPRVIFWKERKRQMLRGKKGKKSKKK